MSIQKVKITVRIGIGRHAGAQLLIDGKSTHGPIIEEESAWLSHTFEMPLLDLLAALPVYWDDTTVVEDKSLTAPSPSGTLPPTIT